MNSFGCPSSIYVYMTSDPTTPLLTMIRTLGPSRVKWRKRTKHIASATSDVRTPVDWSLDGNLETLYGDIVAAYEALP